MELKKKTGKDGDVKEGSKLREFRIKVTDAFYPGDGWERTGKGKQKGERIVSGNCEDKGP